MTSRTHNSREATLLARAAARIIARAAALTMAVLVAAGPGVSQAAPTTAEHSAATGSTQAVPAELGKPSGSLNLAAAALVDSVKVSSNRTAAASPWSKTWAFTQCIFGTGVPIGLALGIATTPSVVAWFAGRAVNPPLAYGWATSYWYWLKSRCSYALF